MLQVRKSCFCGISASFFQYCFMSETQLLINGSFQFFFSKNHFLEGGFTFQWGGASFLSGRCPMGWGASALLGDFKKNHEMGDATHAPLCYGKPCRWWVYKRCGAIRGKLKKDSKSKCQTCAT